MYRLGTLLLALGVLLGGGVGLAILLGLNIPGANWIITVGLVKLALIGAAGLLAAGATLQRLHRRGTDREALRPGDPDHPRRIEP